jgi:hypothetical protein
VLCREKPVRPKCDERELSAIVPFHANVGAELCGYGFASLLDLFEHAGRALAFVFV